MPQYDFQSFAVADVGTNCKVDYEWIEVAEARKNDVEGNYKEFINSTFKGGEEDKEKYYKRIEIYFVYDDDNEHDSENLALLCRS